MVLVKEFWGKVAPLITMHPGHGGAYFDTMTTLRAAGTVTARRRLSRRGGGCHGAWAAVMTVHCSWNRSEQNLTLLFGSPTGWRLPCEVITRAEGSLTGRHHNAGIDLPVGEICERPRRRHCEIPNTDVDLEFPKAGPSMFIIACVMCHC